MQSAQRPLCERDQEGSLSLPCRWGAELFGVGNLGKAPWAGVSIVTLTCLVSLRGRASQGLRGNLHLGMSIPETSGHCSVRALHPGIRVHPTVGFWTHEIFYLSAKLCVHRQRNWQ